LQEQYLVNEPIARAKLAAAEKRAARAVADAAALQKRLDDLNSDHTSVNQSNSALNSQIKDLEAELAQIKLMSAGAIEAAENNRRLTGLNTRLRSELETAVAQRTALEDDLQQRWMLIGAGLVIGGLLLGVMIKARPLRSAWN
jgi:SH3 domain protein